MFALGANRIGMEYSFPGHATPRGKQNAARGNGLPDYSGKRLKRIVPFAIPSRTISSPPAAIIHSKR